MYGTLYRIFNIKNGKSYVGKTYSDFYKRLQQHISDSHKYLDRPLYKAFNKYGLEAFSAEILGEYQEGTLEDKEIEYIQLYHSYGNSGYNATLGGDGRRYLNVNIQKLLQEYSDTRNITATARLFKIDYGSCRKLLLEAGVEIGGFDYKKSKRESLSYGVVIEDVGIEFTDPYSCAEFLIYCDIAPNNVSVRNIGSSIRRVCNGTRPSYLGLKFKYI